MSTPPLNHPGQVPDGEALRQALLRASWQRDRQVRQRRTAWRWFLWGLWRYGLPVMAGTLAAVWTIAYTLEWFAAAPASSPRMPPPAASAPSPAGRSEAAPVGSALTLHRPDAISGLRLDTQLGHTTEVRASTVPKGPAAPDPDLKPDNWLHSKEP